MRARWIVMWLSLVVASTAFAGTAVAGTAREPVRGGAGAGADGEGLGALTERVIEDLARGQPLVVQVHAPLCDASIIPCGNARLGDGDNLETNLYWSTTPGFGKWFGRRGGGWKRVLAQQGEQTGDPDLLAVLVYQRMMATPSAWVRRGAPRRFPVFVVICGWRGRAIDRSLTAFARELSGLDERVLELGAGADQATPTVRAGGSAHIVAYSGHNRLMDLERFAWPAPAPRAIGLIALACQTAGYMEEDVPAPTRVPLLMTRDFLFANAAPVEAVVLAFARGGSYAAMRKAAAVAYAEVQKKEVRQVFGAFTNPADARWR